MYIAVVAGPVKAVEAVLEEPHRARLAEELGQDMGHGEEISRRLGLLQGAPELRIVQEVATYAL